MEPVTSRRRQSEGHRSGVSIGGLVSETVPRERSLCSSHLPPDVRRTRLQSSALPWRTCKVGTLPLDPTPARRPRAEWLTA
jgi:hypothetical protein